jgi:DNA primase
MTAKQHVEVERRDLALTNLDKVLYPGGSVTKAHVIDYYIRISKWLLPHFERRSVTMLRFPDGVHGKAFYEKDAPKYTPAWVHTMEVPRQSGGKPIRYICIDDLPTLVWCANVASLELHPFLHRTSELDCPTSVVFDLDPGEGANLVLRRSSTSVRFRAVTSITAPMTSMPPALSLSVFPTICRYLVLPSGISKRHSRSIAFPLAASDIAIFTESRSSG